MTEDRQTILEFPLIFPLKVMGHNTDEFEAFVVDLVQRHAPQSAQTVTRRLSKNSTYRSVTVTFVAESQAQLDAIYGELSSNRERVLMAL